MLGKWASDCELDVVIDSKGGSSSEFSGWLSGFLSNLLEEDTER